MKRKRWQQRIGLQQFEEDIYPVKRREEDGRQARTKDTTRCIRRNANDKKKKERENDRKEKEKELGERKRGEQGVQLFHPIIRNSEGMWVVIVESLFAISVGLSKI